MQSCPNLCSEESARAFAEQLVTRLGKKRAREVGEDVRPAVAQDVRSAVAQEGGNGKEKRRPSDIAGGPPKKPRQMPKMTKKRALCHMLTASAMLGIYVGIPLVIWPAVESILVHQHLLPLLCSQNAAQHIVFQALSNTGLVDSCATVFAAYQAKVTALLASTVLVAGAAGVNLAKPWSTYDIIYNLIMSQILGGDDEDDDEDDDEEVEGEAEGDDESGAGPAHDPKGKKKMRGGKRRTRKRKGRKSRKQTKGDKKRKTKGHKKRKSRRTRKH